MTGKPFLTDPQRKRLQKALRESECSRFREHALILLLKHDGKTYEEIADFIGCSYRTVAYWCVHGDPDNLDTMRDRRENGNYRKADESYIQLLLKIVHKNPNDLGYDADFWTSGRLASYMTQATEISLSGTQIIRILRKHKIRLPRSRV